MLSIRRGGDHCASILGEDVCTCANRVVKDLSLEVLWVGRVRTRGENWVRWVECWVLEREWEARLDDHRVVRVGREPWGAVRSE